MRDEFVRHKLLDAVGDLYLAGAPDHRPFPRAALGPRAYRRAAGGAVRRSRGLDAGRPWRRAGLPTIGHELRAARPRLSRRDGFVGCHSSAHISRRAGVNVDHRVDAMLACLRPLSLSRPLALRRCLPPVAAGRSRSPPAAAHKRTPISKSRSTISTTAPWTSWSTSDYDQGAPRPSTRSKASIPIRSGRPRRS